MFRLGSITGWIEALGQDLRYTARGMCKRPAFTLVAVLTLTLGVGGTATIFSAIDALLLRPLPYPDHDRLVALSLTYQKYPQAHGPVSDTDVAHWRADNHVFEQIESVSGPDMVAMSSAGGAERVGVQHVSTRLFSLLGIKAFLGALPTDEKRGSEGVAISYEFWQHHFRSDPNVLGRSIFVDTASTSVIAVLNPGFNLFGTGVPEAYFIHGTANPAESGFDDPRWLFAIGKLKRGVSLEQAQAGMNLTAQRLSQAFPANYKEVGVRVEPLQKGLFGWSEQVLYLLFLAVGFVLLIACVNVANLLMVRGDGRRREFGVRVALGASRKSLIRQLLTESVVLSLLGGVAGLALSFWGLRLLNLLSSRQIPIEGVSLDGRVVLFTFGTCIVTGLVFGLIPAFRASKSDVNDCLREGGRSTATKSRHRTRNILVVAEIAVALVSLICAGLMINTLTRVLHTDPGFNPDHLLTAEVRLTGDKYMNAMDQEKTGFNVINPPVGIFCRQVLERVKSMPGVQSAALVDWLPLAENPQHAWPGFTITGRAVASAEKPDTLRDSVSPDYFRLMGIPILRGRGITEQDTGDIGVGGRNQRSDGATVLAARRSHWTGDCIRLLPRRKASADCRHRGKRETVRANHGVATSGVHRLSATARPHRARLDGKSGSQSPGHPRATCVGCADRRRAPDDFGTRPRFSRLRGQDGRRNRFKVGAAMERSLSDVGNFCGDGVASCCDRDLRRDLLFRQRAQPRTWPAHGAGRAAEGCGATGFAAGDDAFVFRRADWRGRFVCRSAITCRIPLRSETSRRADTVSGFIAFDGRDAYSQLCPCAPCHRG